MLARAVDLANIKKEIHEIGTLKTLTLTLELDTLRNLVDHELFKKIIIFLVKKENAETKKLSRTISDYKIESSNKFTKID